jgi:hypothetical protein
MPTPELVWAALSTAVLLLLVGAVVAIVVAVRRR